jgi:hypothetical protein
MSHAHNALAAMSIPPPIMENAFLAGSYSPTASNAVLPPATSAEQVSTWLRLLKEALT